MKIKKIITHIFTALTIILLVAWIQYPDLIQWEPIIGITLLLKEVFIQWQMRKIESLEFSPAVSLAHGYVNNFLEPAVSELMRKNVHNSLNFNIYIPDELEELSDQQIERIKYFIQSKGYQLKEIKLKRKTGRPHDVLTVEKQKGTISYFDFPRTLLSLQSYIDYKVKSGRNENAEHKKHALGVRLVGAFRDEVQRLIKKKNLENSITFVGKSLEM